MHRAAAHVDKGDHAHDMILPVHGVAARRLINSRLVFTNAASTFNPTVRHPLWPRAWSGTYTLYLIAIVVLGARTHLSLIHI